MEELTNLRKDIRGETRHSFSTMEKEKCQEKRERTNIIPPSQDREIERSEVVTQLER